MTENAREWPAGFIPSRSTLQRIAVHVVARRRAMITGRFGLRPTPGGFGTPIFGDDEVVRVSGANLVRERRVDGQLLTTTVGIAGSSLRRLAEFVGVELDPTFSVGRDTVPLDDIDEPLTLVAEAALAIGDWYAFGARAIDRALAAVGVAEGGVAPDGDVGGGDDPVLDATVAQIWPEHFDLGLDLASPAGPERARVNLGASAGDGYVAEPYLYVGPRDAQRPGDADYWNAPFGAMVGFSAVASDAEADAFFARGLMLLRDA